MWDLPRPGLEPVSPALAGRLSTTAPPGKPCPPILISFLYMVSSKSLTSLSCMWIFSCSVPLLEKIILSPLNYLVSLFENQLTINVWFVSWLLILSIDLYAYPYAVLYCWWWWWGFVCLFVCLNPTLARKEQWTWSKNKHQWSSPSSGSYLGIGYTTRLISLTLAELGIKWDVKLPCKQ